MAYLTNTVETYRVDTETEATAMIEAAKKDNHYILAKYSCIYKERKEKKEVVDSWYRVSLYKEFNDEKEPTDVINISYSTNGGAEQDED